MIVVNKADGEHAIEAGRGAETVRCHPAHLPPRHAVASTGADHERLARRRAGHDVDTVLKHRETLSAAGEFEARRRTQQVDWTWTMVRDTVLDRVLSNAAVKANRDEVERQVRDGEFDARVGGPVHHRPRAVGRGAVEIARESHRRNFENGPPIDFGQALAKAISGRLSCTPTRKGKCHLMALATWACVQLCTLNWEKAEQIDASQRVTRA